MTLIEAQAVGTPVVAFDVGGIRAAIWPPHRHRLAPLDDWTQFFARIEKSIFEKKETNVRADLRDWACRLFSASEVVRKQIACYQAVFPVAEEISCI